MVKPALRKNRLRPLNIKQFLTLSSFLHAHVAEMKRRNPKWSLSVWERVLGGRSKTSLVKILQGNRIPGPTLIQQLIEYFKLSPEDSEHFKKLIHAEKYKGDPSLARSLFQNIDLETKGRVEAGFDIQTITAMTHWYYVAILAWASSKKAPVSIEKMQKLLNFTVSREELVKAVDDLTAVGLIIRRPKGGFKLSPSWQAMQPVKLIPQNETIQEKRVHYYREVLNNTIDALPTSKPSETDFRVICLPMKKDKTRLVKDLLDEFGERVAALVEDEKTETLYQLQIQLLPITHQ